MAIATLSEANRNGTDAGSLNFHNTAARLAL
jgi:hypothetical protein